MKRKLATVLALMALVAFPAKAYDFAVRLNSGDSLWFEVTDVVRGHVSVVPPSDDGTDYYKGHRKISGVLVIPAEVSYDGKTYSVTAIGERAFSGCADIRMVSIPSSVTSIGSYAFYGCVGINDPVVIGENVTRVGLSAFYGCAQLPAVVFKARRCDFMGGSLATAVFGNCPRLKKVTVGDGVTRIPDYAFCGADGVSSSVTLPPSLEYIGVYAFSFCSQMPGEMVVPDQVTTIGECAFNQCHSITSLTLGASVDSIGDRAFCKCVGLRSVTVRATAPPKMEGSSFSSLTRAPSFSIPCVGRALYEKDAVWGTLTPFKTHGSCTFKVQAQASREGEAQVLGGGNFKYGDSVTLVAAPAAGYAFVGWSDGNRENPRRFAARGDLAVSALTKALEFATEKETVYRVDTVFSGGVKVIRDTVDVFSAFQPLEGGQTGITFDAAKKRLVWDLGGGDKMLSLMVFNVDGECIYRTDSDSGKFKMHRFHTGSYFVRVETVGRVANYRFFMNNE